jgi:hypothetical protein
VLQEEVAYNLGMLTCVEILKPQSNESLPPRGMVIKGPGTTLASIDMGFEITD